MASAFVIATNLEASGTDIILRLAAVIAGNDVPDGRQFTEFRVTVNPGESPTSLKNKLITAMDAWAEGYNYALNDVTMPTFQKKTT